MPYKALHYSAGALVVTLLLSAVPQIVLSRSQQQPSPQKSSASVRKETVRTPQKPATQKRHTSTSRKSKPQTQRRSAAFNRNAAAAAPLRIEAERVSASSKLRVMGTELSWIQPNAWARYDNVQLGNGYKKLRFRYAKGSPTSGAIEVRAGSLSGPLLGQLNPVPTTGGWQVFSEAVIDVTGASGAKTLFFVFRSQSGGSVTLDWAQFEDPVPAGPAVYPGTRDPWLWPFSQDSIWNMPIGSGARYVPARIGAAPRAGIDTELIYKASPNAVRRPVYYSSQWAAGRCEAANFSRLLGYADIDNSVVIPDATAVPFHTPNSATAFLQKDGRTLIQANPVCREVAGSNFLTTMAMTTTDILGTGYFGGHGGSGLSTIGGSIRLGELTGPEPIRHALKINLWNKKWTYYGPRHGNTRDTTPGYRWPAIRADLGAPMSCTDHRSYCGTNPALEMGALLAIPPSVTKASLNLQTPAGQKLFDALQNYGAYLVDGTGWDTHDFPMQEGVAAEYRAKYGHSIDHVNSGSYRDDVNKLVQALQVIDNNGPSSIGGGGTPRVPLAPAFNMTAVRSSQVRSSSQNAGRSLKSLRLHQDTSRPSRKLSDFHR